MSTHAVAHQHEAVGGTLFTPGYKTLLWLVAIGGVAVIWRFVFGIGAVSNLSNGYPWGIWIALDVVTGTALGCGGYAVAIMVYILNKGEYHPLVRPAVLTSLLGYGLAVVAVTIDLGRYWDLWKVPIFFWRWSHSPQLEVALCVAAYVAVLLVEMSPAFFEKWSATEPGVLGTVARRGLTVVNKALVWILALGLLLPTMHQSSLGTMMLLPASKLHPLWFTPWLPLLFMVNAIVMGFGAVVLESHIAARAFKRPIETAMLGKLTGAAFYVAAGWLAFRLVEVAIAGDAVHLGSWRGGAFIVETLLLVWALVLMTPARRGRPGDQFRSALLLVVAGTVFRVNVYLIGFQPGGNYSYFPALPELFITLGIIALEVALYVAAVRKFPILSGRSSAATAR